MFLLHLQGNHLNLIKRRNKSSRKQQKQQIAKEQTPPATPPPPTHEIVKSGSSKLANGKRYIDVASAQITVLIIIDTLSYVHDCATCTKKKAKAADPVVVDIPGFIREFFPPECASIVDVYCDPPFDGWKELADHKDLALEYYFSMGCHPHNAKKI